MVVLFTAIVAVLKDSSKASDSSWTSEEPHVYRPIQLIERLSPRSGRKHEAWA